MKKLILSAATVLLAATAVMAQQQQAAQAGPKPKSQKEVQALQKVQQATNPEDRIKAIDEVLENFADTEYKPLLLQMAVESARQANDYPKVLVYGDRALQADPKSYTAMLAIASATVQNTKEFDLDKDEKLAKVQKYANGAIEELKTAPSPNPQITGPQWDQEKKQLTAEAYADLGACGILQKKYDVAINNYKSAADLYPNPVILVRMANAYNEAKQPDNAIAAADKVLAQPDAPPQVKQFAQQEKARAEKAKTAAK